MMTVLSMLILIFVYACIVVAKIKYQPNKETFFDLHDSTMLKGMFCIIVVLVHIPAAYQNRIQDMIGSFAYIGVTFFFMTSAYGLKYSILHKKGYLRQFWLRRIPALLIPAILCNLVSIIIKAVVGHNISILSFVNINDWVKVLLLFYFVFWLTYYLADQLKLARGGYGRDIFICLVILSFSLIDRLTPIKMTLLWPTESMGFIYGILLADFIEVLKVWTNCRWKLKSIIFFASGGILGVLYLKFKTINFFGDYCLKILLGIVLLTLILQLIRRITIGNRALAFLGNISYEVYLLHGTAFMFLAEVSGIKRSGLFIWGALITTIIIAAAVKKISDIILSAVRKATNKIL